MGADGGSDLVLMMSASYTPPLGAVVRRLLSFAGVRHPESYPSPGEVLDGKYRIDGYVGEGGMGAVASATHLLRKAPVALKFMSPLALIVKGSVDRFMNEAVAASRLTSEHIVQVFDVGKLPSGAPYMVLELLSGQDLAELLTDGRLEVPRAAHIALQVLRGLEAAHAAGVIHRDLKPSNVFLTRHEGDREFVKILDFGISKVTAEPGGASITQTNSALGTPLYMSPEQARNPRDVDPRTDLYSAGVILYEMLSGRAPHTVENGEVTAVLYKLFTQDPPPLAAARPELPAALCALVHKALAREPADRFQSAREMALALATYCDERSQVELTRLGQRPISEAPARVVVRAPPAEDSTRPSSPDRTSVDASAATQASAAPVAMVHTDLSLTKETSAAAPPARAKLSLAKVVVAATVVGVLGVGVVTYDALTRKDAHQDAVVVTPSALPSIAPSAAPSASVVVVTTASVPSVAPSARAVVSAPSASQKLGLKNITLQP